MCLSSAQKYKAEKYRAVAQTHTADDNFFLAYFRNDDKIADFFILMSESTANDDNNFGSIF